MSALCVGSCARGCATSRVHLPTCEAPDNCKGCTPRPAAHGVLCTPCHGHLVRALYTAPDLVAHLQDVGLTGGAGDRVTGSRELPLAVPAAIDAADTLHATLASWVQLVTEEHPDDLTGPSPEGQRWPEHTTRRIGAAGWVAACGDCIGLDNLDGGPRAYTSSRAARVAATTHVDTHPGHVVTYRPDDDHTWHTYPRPADCAGLKPGAGARPTHEAATWLRAHLDWIEDQPWVVEMLREITSLNATTAARWPTEERARRIPGTPCPSCDRLTLTYHPPTWAGADITVQCDHHDCATLIPEDDWPAFVHRAHEQREAG